MSDESEAKEKGIVLPRWSKTIISGIAVTAVTGAFNMYTEYVSLRQEVATMSRGYVRQDEKLVELDKRVTAVEKNQDAYHVEGISRLDLILQKLGIHK